VKAQDIFDTVVTHLYTQGRRAVLAGGGCLYLAPDGTQCAVGALLEPDGPACQFRGGVTDLIAAHPDDVPEWLAENLVLLKGLQQQHDIRDDAPRRAAEAAEAAHFGRTLEAGLRHVAARNGLDYRAEHYPTPPEDWK